MNTPKESSTVLAGHDTSADAIRDHAQAVLAHAMALVELSSTCNDDEITKVCEAIVLELASITAAQDLELEEILPTETCQECGRECLDFLRSKVTEKVTCMACLVIESASLDGKLDGSRAAVKAAREAELDAAWAHGHASGKRTASEIEKSRPEAKPTRLSRHTRASVLDAASVATTQREDQYGAPGPMFLHTAEHWSIILGTKVRAHHVALCLAALKIARAVEDPAHGDNWVDLAGYAACGGEVALARRPV